MTNRTDQVKALANETRLEVLRLLCTPSTHFAHQKSADPTKMGVCVQILAEHFGISQPTMSRHIELLRRAQFITAQRQGQWTYCTRNEEGLSEYADWLQASLKIKGA